MKMVYASADHECIVFSRQIDASVAHGDRRRRGWSIVIRSCPGAAASRRARGGTLLRQDTIG